MTPKQQRFVREYLIDMNATQAAIRAGYSEESASEIGSQLLRKTTVADAIAGRQEKIANKLEVTQERIIAEYAKIAFSDPRQIAEWGPDGVSLIDSELLDDDAAACVAEVSETRNEYGSAMKFKLHDKKGALDSLAKHLGMFVDRQEVKHELNADGASTILAALVARLPGKP
jgi:phage terminase small subunit